MSKVVTKTYTPVDVPSDNASYRYVPIEKTPFVESNPAYSVSIIARGEQLRYADARGVIIVEISIPGRWVDAESIRRWNRARDVNDDERAAVLERIVRFLGARDDARWSVIHGTGA